MECNTGPSEGLTLVSLSLQFFVATRQKRGNYTLPQHFRSLDIKKKKKSKINNKTWQPKFSGDQRKNNRVK